MAKRHVAADDTASHNRDHKRQKFVSSGKSPAGPETVTSARHLQFLLSFQQDAPQQLTVGIQSFRNFLNSILYPPESDDDIGARKAILVEFLQSQKPRNADDEHIFLESLIQTWSYASQTNNSGLVGAATAVLALLLKLLSSQLDLHEHGVNLCRTILQIPQLKLLSRSLTAPKHNEFVISPALRLLTEVVSFDGGIFAKRLYSHREFAFDPQVIARNISNKGASEDRDPAKPSLRSNTIKYLLANFKYQNEGAKADIIKNGNISRSLFAHLVEDAPELVKNILQVLKTNVILDEDVPRSSKSYLFDDRNLASIAGVLRKRHAEDQSDDSGKSVQQVTYEFLILVCTTPNLGVLRNSQGWYPPSTVQSHQSEDETNGASVDLGLDGIDWYSNFIGRVPVRNTALASFLQVLRPYSNELEQQLLLEIFKASPELVADYFFKKATFSFDPKLTATWIGYSSFLFSTVQLPIPLHFGLPDGFAAAPPPASIVVESILPQPLTQKVLTRCLNQTSELISFFATRILVVALQKLKRVLKMFDKAASAKGALWAEATKRLQSEVAQRCVPMKDLMMLFRKTSPEKIMQYEATTRLLSLYYDVLPLVALEEKLDASISLTSALEDIEKQTEEGELVQMRMITLGHLLHIARHTQGMQWWKKPDTLQYSPFTTLLKLASNSKTYSSEVAAILESIVDETAILQTKSNPSALMALLASLRPRDDVETSAEVIGFLDSCLTRFMKRPIKYEDDLDALIADEIPGKKRKSDPIILSVSLLAIVEQISFVEKAKPKAINDVVEWLAKFLNFLTQCGENTTALKAVRDRIVESALSSKSAIRTLNDAFKREEQLGDFLVGLKHDVAVPEIDKMEVEHAALDFSQYWKETRVPQEDEKHNGLNRWTQKDVEEAIEDGHIEALLLCLSSRDESISRQALTNVRKFIVKLDASTYEEREQLSLLLNEFVETISQRSESMPVPYLATTFTSATLRVLTDPTHCMYAKINKFLNRGPAWTISKLPSYWAQHILLEPPELDDAHYQEVSWMLDWLFDGLRTPEDMNRLRICGTFERILSLYSAACVTKSVKESILKIVSRATSVEGGSTTLVTRTGILSWLDGMVAVQNGDESLLKALKQRIWDTCDQGKVMEWSGGEVRKLVQKDIV
ncbi:hypothetical protein NA57DRAFT_51996 [Rhizodiscina lignyota]|uniref:Nucleolar pre-ribosomal-associated protein 1 n=1 Tax=Rhizodiscina lignyota TaxID=1504668 RepID=A0A9P4M9R6_9PEZI|nr:hypothetical protein NA57DRAFT_51996 [Rhizodiscina lignyota]